MPKSNLTDNGRKVVIDELLKISNNGELPPVAGVVGVEWAIRIKKNSGRKRNNRDDVREKLNSVPIEDRAVERRVAAVSGLSSHLIRQAVKEGMVVRRTTFIKPH
ncbi:hypothetical protein PC129_g23729 [Phytophthora cactorum]|uniref:Winged helix-turn-helix DNA-binding domain n=1 Tax=Phytophthora cactorum TaxID=29920 RepID=A0A329RMZ7_9STRA|nr:hypothetical protein PC112_g18003 [Phytophthora cactorum]KAG2807681.1 hypothetical protein PC111_g16824 [Phytophthora cactorum]KAG2809442.1 hypothetical protein PC113_g23877 [Phytophthora cactorum]KAG2875352.1 hypothetical protein PC115_g23933 [Phytophthora cactorum]KAG2903048.1 hypothetical protein PC114_g12431 [Phytophthora cactorum]